MESAKRVAWSGAMVLVQAAVQVLAAAWSLAAAVAVSSAVLSAWPSDLAAQQLAIVDVNVVPMTDSVVLQRQTVLIEGDRIVRLGPVDSVAVPAGVERIEGRGGYLLPGLHDMHAHLFRAEDLPLYVANGVLTVQVLNAGYHEQELKESVRRGVRLGPTLRACHGPVSGLADSAAAERAVSAAAGRSFDCLKPYGDIAPEAYRVLHDAAGRRGLRTVGHIPRGRTWREMLAVRPSAVAHAEEFLYSPIESAAAVDTIVAGMRAGGIALVGTLANYERISRQILELPELERRAELAEYSPVHRRAWSGARNRYASFRLEQLPGFRRRLRFQRSLVRRLATAGATILAGTDAGNTFVLPGYALHEELQELVRSGLSPYRALRAATADAARFLDSDAGTVEPGRRADLVLVYGNPLADVANASLIGGVMVRGRWLERPALRALLDSTRVGFALEAAYLARADSLGVMRALQWLEAEVARGRAAPGVIALNEHAYQLWRLEERQADAARVFEANVRLHPESWIALGSLGELRLAAGDTAAARALFERALRVSPGNTELLELLESAGARPPPARRRG